MKFRKRYTWFVIDCYGEQTRFKDILDKSAFPDRYDSEDDAFKGLEEFCNLP